jgi:hypothetical protein
MCFGLGVSSASADCIDATKDLHDFCYGLEERLCGVLDGSGRVVVPFKYFPLGIVCHDLVLFRGENDLYGYLNLRGEVAIPPKFYSAGNFSDGTAFVTNKEGRSALLGRDGNQITDFVFGRNSLSTGGKYIGVTGLNGAEGCVTRAGKFALEPKYKRVDCRDDLFLILNAEKKWGAVSIDGKTVVPAVYDDLMYDGDRLVARQGESAGYLDKTGKQIGEFRFARLYPRIWATKLAHASVATGRGQLNGLIDTDGKFVIPPRYSEVRRPSDGLARVELGGKWGFTNLAGLEVVPPTFAEAHDFSEGLAAVNTGSKNKPKWGYIDVSGRVVIAPMFSWAGAFTKGLGAVGKFGEAEPDARQELIALIKDLKLKGRSPEETRKAIDDFLVKNKGRPLGSAGRPKETWGLIDKSGKPVVALENDEVQFSFHGMPFLRTGKVWKAVDSSGKTIWQSQK